MLPASDSFLQSFVRLINKSNEAGEVSITAVDDGGNVYDTVTVQLAALQTLHFNSGDLADGNANKGIGDGIGAPMQGNWRLQIDTALDVEALSYIRARDGFLTAMHELLPAGDDGYQVKIFNPASNETQQSRLRLINWGAEDETVRIEGVDDGGSSVWPISLTLPAGQSRTLTAIDLEQGAEGLDGTLGDGTGKWQLIVRGNAGSVAAQSLLYASSGHVSNLSAAGRLAVSRAAGDLHGNSIVYATTLAIGREQAGWIYPAGDIDVFGVKLRESGTLTVYTTGSTDTSGELQPGAIDIDAYAPFYTDNYSGEGTNFRMEADVADGGYYYISVAGVDAATGSYTLHTEFVQDDHGDLHGNDFFDATTLAIGGEQPGRIYPVHDIDWFRVNVADSGTLTLYTTGYFATTGFLRDVARRRIAYQFGGLDGEETNFRINRRVDAGTYFVTVGATGYRRSDGRIQGTTGDYAIHAEFTPN